MFNNIVKNIINSVQKPHSQTKSVINMIPFYKQNYNEHVILPLKIINNDNNIYQSISQPKPNNNNNNDITTKMYIILLSLFGLYIANLILLKIHRENMKK